MRFLLFVLSSVFTQLLFSQPQPTPASTRWHAGALRDSLSAHSLIRQLNFENIGPTIFSGRVTDIDVNPEDPSHFYVAYASGGLWYTENNGASFTPVFDDQAVMTIGDIAVDWKHDIIWVGTGENNSSRSSYSGLGIYRSADGGKTWEHRGLPESHHIGRILLDPVHPDMLWVGVLGNLYSPSNARGVYYTENGGKTWTQTLFIGENAGVVDLVRSNTSPATLYAAVWERTRRAWNFTEAGPASAIYRSTDHGIHWSHMTNAQSGFPSGLNVGRIGLAITADEGQDLLYAIVDNYERRPKEGSDERVLTREMLRQMSREDFLALDKKMISAYLADNGFPDQYTADTILVLIKEQVIEPVTLVNYLEDANSLLFDTDVVGAEVYVSRDEGVTWKRTHEKPLNGLFYTYGYYFGQIRVSPHDPQKLYVLGVPILMSEDGGQSWQDIGGDNVHGDHHALWLSPGRDEHIVLGNDGGINISYDDGDHWVKCNSPAVGQFYSVQTDRAKTYRVYGGLQDNGVWMGSHQYRGGTGWHGRGRYPYEFIYGGDGMQVQVDFRDNQTVYTGLQFGNYARLNTLSGDNTFITPQHDLTERPYRWNWQTPIWLSRHQQDILYMGSQYLHRSLDKGDHFEKISDDLTLGGETGDIPYGTLTTIHESPLVFGLLYTGSDDGLIHVSQDFGHHWERISDDLPPHLWVSRVRASVHERSRVYISLNGYRWDHFDPYLYVSEDYGDHWNRIGLDLPPEPVNVIIEDPVNPDLIFVGTDGGLYVSLDRGQTFMTVGKSLPAVAVHDLDIQPVARHLLVGTHGRSFYKADISELEQLTPSVLAQDLYLFDVAFDKMRIRKNWGKREAEWQTYPLPEVVIPLYVKTSGKLTLRILSEDREVFSEEYETVPGLNYLPYDLTISERHTDRFMKVYRDTHDGEKIEIADNGRCYLPAGKYVIEVTSGKAMERKMFELK